MRYASNNQLASKWIGKTWNVVGDSITEHNFRTSKNYHDYIKDKIAITVNNYGVSGTGYITPATAGTEIYNRIGSLATSDLISVFAGTNDWGGNKTLGTFGDTGTTTVYGGIYTVINNLITNFPTKTITVFTPLPRSDSYGTVSPANNTASTPYSLRDVADAVIKVANHFGIPCLDLYRTANLPVWNATANDYYFKATGQPSPDGLHPNDNGHKVLADKILAFLNTL